MRVLFVSVPLLGHLNPMLPLAMAVRDAGHEVRIASGGDALAGLPPGVGGVDVAPGFDFGRVARRVLLLRHPLLARRELAGSAGTRGVALLFGAVNDALAPHVLRAAREWAADIVVHEPLTVAGALAAADLGVPAVVHGTGLFDAADLARVTTAALSGGSGAAVPPPALVLTIAPPSVVGGHEGRPLRPVPYSGEGTVPAWLTEQADPDRPRILVSRSTIAGPGGGDLMGAVVAAAVGLDAQVVLVRPPAKLVARGLPGNVTAVDRLPLAPAVAASSAVVHHGGASTALDALAAGVPQLLTPGPGDRRRNAELVAARGAGLAVRPRAITTAHLRTLFADQGLRAAAAEVRAEIAGLPAPQEVAVDVVETARAG